MERKIISHRGNLNGPSPKTENKISTINNALNLGFDVEIDIRLLDEKLYLGHDEILYNYEEIERYLLLHANKLWIHCKNIEALSYLLKYPALNLFGHNNDDFVLTSRKEIFCKPGINSNEKYIIVMPELIPIYTTEILDNCHGILTDYPIHIKEKNYGLFML